VPLGDPIQAGADLDPPQKKGQTVAQLAELIDAVVGVDTHRDTHQVEIAYPTGAPIATTAISNDSTGDAELLAWIFDYTPGPRLTVSIEGTRSYADSGRGEVSLGHPQHVQVALGPAEVGDKQPQTRSSARTTLRGSNTRPEPVPAVIDSQA
jgi:hypothetical protein